MKISIDLIDPNPEQPRTHFAGIEELAESIKTHGLLEPIMLRPAGERFQIIHGERRWRAAKLAGLTEIKATVKEATNTEAFNIAVIENLQRENLNPIEEGRAFQKMKEHGYTQCQIADLIGKTQSYVSHKVGLLKLPPLLAMFLQEGALTENHIRQLLKLKALYGEDLEACHQFEAFKGLRTDQAGDMQAVLFLLRPEEAPKTFPNHNEFIGRAFAELKEYVSKHNFRMKQWELTAFWYGCLATCMNLSVNDLTTAIDAYSERYESALVWWFGLGGKDKPEDEEYWGFHTDLKHSSSLDANKINEHTLQRGLERVKEADSYIMPSSSQYRAQEALRAG